ncbi:MAG: hypothetical protein AAB503_02780 [Patescibacteria group bacterium]
MGEERKLVFDIEIQTSGAELTQDENRRVMDAVSDAIREALPDVKITSNTRIRPADQAEPQSDVIILDDKEVHKILHMG